MKLRFYHNSNAGLVTKYLYWDKLLENVPRFLCRHEGILAILVTDRDGVPLVKGETIESQSSSVKLYQNQFSESRRTLELFSIKLTSSLKLA